MDTPFGDGHVLGTFVFRTEKRGEGAGIGLAVCRRIIEAHGGRSWVEPAHGSGSAFPFTLRCPAAAA